MTLSTLRRTGYGTMVLQNQECLPATPPCNPACPLSNFLPWDFMTHDTHTLPSTVWAPMKWPWSSYVWCGSNPILRNMASTGNCIQEHCPLPTLGAPPGPLCLSSNALSLHEADEVTANEERRTQALSQVTTITESSQRESPETQPRGGRGWD